MWNDFKVTASQNNKKKTVGGPIKHSYQKCNTDVLCNKQHVPKTCIKNQNGSQWQKKEKNRSC